MSDQRKGGISWTDETWNPVRGCSKVSAGCAHCYAESMAARFCGEGLPYHGLIRDGHWSGDVRFVPEKLDEPLRWKRPRRIFVNSMSDWCHPNVTNHMRDKMLAVMLLGHWHTYQLLTKRAHVMLDYLSDPALYARVLHEAHFIRDGRPELTQVGISNPSTRLPPWIHLGVSCEDQQAADERIPLLLQCPAVVRWISGEPLLGHVDFDLTGISWVVVGGESGPHARPMHPDWARSIRDQCRAAGVPFHFKQHGEWVVASEANGVIGSTMPPTGERYTWLGFDGKTQNPSHKVLLDPVYAIARVGKKRAGHLLDGEEYRMYPGDVWI